MTPLNKRIIRKLKESKLQYAAIIVVMFLGIMIYISFNMGIYNFENSVMTYYDKNNFGDIYAEVMKIPSGGLLEINNIPGVKKVEGRIKKDVVLKTKAGEKVSLRLVSFDPSDQINRLFTIDGKTVMNSKYEGFVIEHFFEARGIEIGDILHPQIAGKVYDIEVVANVGSPEYIYLLKDQQTLLPNFKQFGLMYVDKSFLQDSLGIGNAYNEIVIDVAKGYNVEKVKNAVDKVIDKYGVRSLYTKKNQLSNRVVSEEIKGGKQSADTVPLLFIIIATIILSVMLKRLVKGDRVTIGVLKSMGYSNMQVLIHYSKFSIFIGSFGALIGIGTGILLSKYFTSMYLTFYKVHYVTVEYYPMYLVMALILGIGFSVAAGFWGARGVLQIEPAESMRKEPPKKGKRVFLEKTKIWGKIKFSTKMVWRNLMRAKGRVLFIAFGVAVTFLVTVMPLFLFDVSINLFTRQFGEVMTMDYNVKFDRPMSKESIDTIKSKIEYEKIEPVLEYPFNINHKWKSKGVSVIGVMPHTDMYHFNNINKQIVNISKGDVFITEGLAKLLSVKVGDTIEIENYLPGKDDLRVKVTEIVEQGLGTNIYMDYPTMASKLADTNSITGVYINSDDDIKSILGNVKNISEVQSLQDMQGTFEEFMQITIASISSMLFIGFILGFAIIYNSTIMVINKRKLEFSSLRILGMAKKQIFNIVFKENIVIMIIGITIGIPLSALSASKISEVFSTDFYTFPGEVPTRSYIYGAIATVIFVLIAQGASYFRINRLNFIEALKERIT